VDLLNGERGLSQIWTYKLMEDQMEHNIHSRRGALGSDISLRGELGLSAPKKMPREVCLIEDNTFYRLK